MQKEKTKNIFSFTGLKLNTEKILKSRSYIAEYFFIKKEENDRKFKQYINGIYFLLNNRKIFSTSVIKTLNGLK